MVFKILKKKQQPLLTISPDPHIDTTEHLDSPTEACEIRIEQKEQLEPEHEKPLSPTIATDHSTKGNDLGDAAAYQLGPVIHRDAHSTVYRAMRKGSQDRLAMHVFLTELSEAQLKDKFTRAAAKATTWSHKNVAKVHDYGFSESHKPFVVTDEIQGSSLHDILQREKKFNKERTIRIFTDISDALGYISWTQSHVDDLSTGNIMLVRDSKQADSLKLINIGLQQEITAELEGLPPTGNFVAYASPERCLGQDTDERSAIYSVGCMMFEALTGKPPFSADTEMQVIQKHLTERPPCVFKEGRKRDRKLENIVMRCLEKKPADRFQTFNELSGELESLSHTHKTLAPKAATPRFVVPWARAFTVTGDCLIAIVAFTLAVGSIQFMMKDYNRQLHQLKATIRDAQQLSGDLHNQHEQWATALAQARALHQPPSTIADLQLNHGQTLIWADKKAEGVREFQSALDKFEREGCQPDLEAAATTVFYAIGTDNQTRNIGETPFEPYTREYNSLYKTLLQRLSKYDVVPETYHTNAKLDLAGILVQQGHYDQAEKIYKEFLNASPPR